MSDNHSVAFCIFFMSKIVYKFLKELLPDFEVIAGKARGM